MEIKIISGDTSWDLYRKVNKKILQFGSINELDEPTDGRIIVSLAISLTLDLIFLFSFLSC
jgi:hypothetical protein